MKKSLLGYSTSTKKVNSKKDLLFYALLLIIPLAQFGIFYIGVNFNSLMLAFQKVDGNTGVRTWLSINEIFKNFSDVFTNSESQFLGIYLRNSILAWFFSCFVCTFFAVIFSYYIYRKRKCSFFFKFLLFLPSVIPSILLTCIFQYFTDDLLVTFLSKICGIEGLQSFIQIGDMRAFILILIWTTWISFGSQVLLYTNAMNQIDKSVLEAADMDGSTPFKTLIRVVVPAIMPTIGTFLIAGIATIFTGQANLFNFYQAQSPTAISTFGYIIYTKSGTAVNYPYCAALGILCSFVAIPLTVLVRKFVKRFER